MKTRILAATALLALASLAVMPIAAEAQNAPRPYAGRGYSGTPPPGGPTRGGGAVVNPGGHYNTGAYRGNYASGWRGPPGYGHRPWTSHWRPAWGWGGWGWGGRGWGVGWNPGWWGPGWGWGGWGWGAGWNSGWWGPGWGWSVGAPVVVTPSVTGAWILPPSATTFIERDVETTPPPAQPAQQWWYWCASSRAYYPYVENCAEAWQRIEPRVPPGTQ